MTPLERAEKFVNETPVCRQLSGVDRNILVNDIALLIIESQMEELFKVRQIIKES